MHQRLSCLAALGFLAVATSARADLVIPTVDYPALTHQARSAEGFAPRGWKVETTVTGDLNGDGLPDLAIVLRENDPKNVIHNDGMGVDPFDTNPRILALAFARKDGGYDLAVENHLLIPRATMPNLDDYLAEAGGVSIRKGALRVSLHLFSSAGGWSTGTTTYSFRWSSGGFHLVGYDNYDLERNTGETTDVSIDYLSGKMSTTTGNEGKKRPKVVWAKAPANPVTFERIGDGMGFDPQHPETPGAPDQ
ncbi:MAG TPA: hypothetical protein VG407_06800 [Caulobacteraceae bacterium]|jgi:hypothetical protein|nr:hypothetical protein [Caulobacteraceae bacterium]